MQIHPEGPRGPHLDGQRSRLTQIWRATYWYWYVISQESDARAASRLFENEQKWSKWSKVERRNVIAWSNPIRRGINQSPSAFGARTREHCLAVMDGFKFWRYYFPSFLETNWTFIAYILKIIQSSGEADVSFIEAHQEVRSHRINFPVLLLPQDDVWKMPAPLNWFRNEFITWGV